MGMGPWIIVVLSGSFTGAATELPPDVTADHYLLEVGEWHVQLEERGDRMMKMKGHLDVREAVKTAKECVNELFAGEDIGSPRLEEVAFDEMGQVWKVTVSFQRPSILGALADQRTFKVVRINDRTGYIVSVTHRTLTSSS